MHQITAAFSVCSAALLTSRRSVLKSNTPSGRAAEPDRERQQLEDKERRLVDGWGGAKWCQRCLRCLGRRQSTVVPGKWPGGSADTALKNKSSRKAGSSHSPCRRMAVCPSSGEFIDENQEYLFLTSHRYPRLNFDCFDGRSQPIETPRRSIVQSPR